MVLAKVLKCTRKKFVLKGSYDFYTYTRIELKQGPYIDS